MFKGDDQSNAVGVPLYYGFVEAVVLAIFCFYAWKAGWTLAPASAAEVLGKDSTEIPNCAGLGCIKRAQVRDTLTILSTC